MQLTRAPKFFGYAPLLGLAVLAALNMSASPACAQKFIVSGDPNIANPLDETDGLPIVPGNQRFFQNILGGGTKVTVDDSVKGDVAAGTINNFYNTLPGVTSTEYSFPITAADLAGSDLFVSPLPDNYYTPSEINALKDFSRGGGTIFLMGENSYYASLVFPNLYNILNTDLTALGSSLQLVGVALDPTFHTLSNQFLTGPPPIASDPLTEGVSTFSYAYTSEVDGGTPLFFTQTGHVPFVASEGFSSAVPEPATLPIFLLGLTGLGIMERKRKAVMTPTV